MRKPSPSSRWNERKMPRPHVSSTSRSRCRIAQHSRLLRASGKAHLRATNEQEASRIIGGSGAQVMAQVCRDSIVHGRVVWRVTDLEDLRSTACLQCDCECLLSGACHCTLGSRNDGPDAGDDGAALVAGHHGRAARRLSLYVARPCAAGTERDRERGAETERKRALAACWLAPLDRCAEVGRCPSAAASTEGCRRRALLLAFGCADL